MSPETILAQLMDAPPSLLHELSLEQGMYALYDHAGQVRYIGVTKMGLRRRVAQYHVSGDDNSHKYSTIYNAGRMFHIRNNIGSDGRDGPVAKELRRLFIRSLCRAVGVPLIGLDKTALFLMEAEVRRLAPAVALSWNDVRALKAYEPKEALNNFLEQISWPPVKLEAIERQATRWQSMS